VILTFNSVSACQADAINSLSIFTFIDSSSYTIEHVMNLKRRRVFFVLCATGTLGPTGATGATGATGTTGFTGNPG
jgi:hypothetical protein